MKVERTFEVSVAEPCSQEWREMKNSTNSRHCELCNKKVFDLSRMHVGEVALLAMRSAAGERICCRVTRNSHNELILLHAPRSFPAGQIVVSTMLAAGLPLAAQISTTRAKLPTCGPPARPDETVSGCETPQPPATLTGRLLRPDGTGVAAGLVRVRSEQRDTLYVVDELGNFELHAEPGTYDITVQTGDDQAEHIPQVDLHAGDQSFGDLRTRSGQHEAIESETVTMGTMTATVSWSWHGRLRHPLLYLRSVISRK